MIQIYRQRKAGLPGIISDTMIYNDNKLYIDILTKTQITRIAGLQDIITR